MTEGKTLAEYGITNAYTKDEVDALIPIFPTVVSAFINDVGYLTEHQDISGKQDLLTTAQMMAADSGITADKVTLYDTYGPIIVQKQNTLTSTQMSAANSGITAEKVYEYNSFEANINNKADKATTLSGYGITDTYTKDDVENMFETLKSIIDEAIDD
jgi:phage-related tail fiber protein